MFFLLLFAPMSIFADGGLPDSPYIYVEGRAEIEKPADLVTLRFEVVARAPDQPKANEEAQTTANKIFALLKERKVADNDVIAEDLRSEPEFEHEDSYSSKRGKLIGYKVSRLFQVKIRDVTIFPKLADNLIGIGDIEFHAVESGLAKEKELKNEAWDKALANARSKLRERSNS